MIGQQVQGTGNRPKTGGPEAALRRLPSACLMSPPMKLVLSSRVQLIALAVGDASATPLTMPGDARAVQPLAFCSPARAMSVTGLSIANYSRSLPCRSGSVPPSPACSLNPLLQSTRKDRRWVTV